MRFTKKPTKSKDEITPNPTVNNSRPAIINTQK